MEVLSVDNKIMTVFLMRMEGASDGGIFDKYS